MSQDDDQQNFALALVFALILGVVAFAIGVGIHAANKAQKAAGAAQTSSAATTAPSASAGASMPSTASADASAASVQTQAGVVKFLFASGKTDLAAGADKALADTVRGVQLGKKAIISGYTDASGDAVKNAELAKLRAFALRDALINLGLKADQIELRKPADIRANATGSSADARRVDVTLE